MSELSPEAIQQSLEFIAAMVQASHEELDVSFGGLTNLLLLPSAEHAAANQTDVARYVASGSLKAISDNPELADEEIVDAVLSNSGLTRRTGAAAHGNVVIVTSKRAAVTVPSGAVFSGGGFNFTTERAYSAKTSSANIDAATDQLLTLRSDGNYGFTVPVVATDLGVAPTLRRGAVLETEAAIANLVTVYAESDFTGGEDAETNAELIARQAEGLAARTPGNRIGCAAFLRDSVYANFTALSIIGAGDAEMLRDRHTIFPGGFGGRTDWYVRTAADAPVISLVKSCVLIEKTPDGKGIWQFNLDRDDLPGFYDVAAVRPSGDESFIGSYEITADLRDHDLTAIEGELLPDIDAAVEAVFSRFQTAVVRFKDSDTVTTDLTIMSSVRDYAVLVRGLPNLAGVQSLLASRANRGLFGDILVKAPIPCFVSLGFTLLGPPDAEQPDLAALKLALVAKINNMQFTGRLFASDLTKVIFEHLPDGVSVGAVDMLGRILKPNGDQKFLRDTEVLEIPFEPDNMVTARTTGFVTYSELLRISAGILNAPDIL